MNKRRKYSQRLLDLMNRQDRDYEIVLRQLNGPADPDCFYWHLYYKGSRINGGLTEGTAERAVRCAEGYRTSHTRSVISTAYIWDCETETWIPKAELNIM